jgi:hypothetical protein
MIITASKDVVIEGQTVGFFKRGEACFAEVQAEHSPIVMSAGFIGPLLEL